jgi:putative transposase
VLGLVLCAVVHPASLQDRDGARLVLERIRRRFPKLKLVIADGAYAGALEQYVKTALPGQPLRLQIVKRSDAVSGFVVQPWRWVVERTFGWLGRYRRMSKDYEQHTQSSEAMLSLAMVHIMSRRLARGGAF